MSLGERIAAWVCESIDWYGFGRTRGGWVDAAGRLTEPWLPLALTSTAVPVITATGGFCAPATPHYTFGQPGTADHWEPWIEWHPPFKSLADLMPVVSAPRGAIRYGTP